MRRHDHLIPPSLREFEVLLRAKRPPVTFQMWFTNSEDLILHRETLPDREGVSITQIVSYLDGLDTEQMDLVVAAFESIVAESPEVTRALIVDRSGRSVEFDWTPLASGFIPHGPDIDVLVVRPRLGLHSGAELDSGWDIDAPARGLISRGWPT
jgi:hypothetical protein